MRTRGPDDLRYSRCVAYFGQSEKPAVRAPYRWTDGPRFFCLPGKRIEVCAHCEHIISKDNYSYRVDRLAKCMVFFQNSRCTGHSTCRSENNYDELFSWTEGRRKGTLTMDRLHSNDPRAEDPDSVAENLSRLRDMFPEAFRDGGVDFAVLRQLLGGGDDVDDEKYGLVWKGKREARQIALSPSAGTLRPCLEDSVDWDRTKNLLIEGDNLEVLKLLQKSYAGQVKLIYIDPPYNTGKDFVYPDNFRDSINHYLQLTGQGDCEGKRLTSNAEFSGRFHTNWLNMMYPRLKLARTFLREDGAMFVSIDDGEVANLRQICDEIFGEENFVSNVIWQKKYTRANDAKWFSDNHDHILVYARRKEALKLNGQPRNEEQLKSYSNPDNHPKGPWKATPLHAKSGKNTKPFTFSNGITWAPPNGTYRRFNDASMLRMDEMDEIWFGMDGNQIPQRKTFLREAKKGVTPTTLWTHQEAGHNHEANNDLKALGLGGVFDNPKPVRLIRMILDLVTNTNTDDVVMDFFAGSGTTAHATINANASDGGNRRFICIQIPEPIEPVRHAGDSSFSSIADFAAARIRRAGEEAAEEGAGNGLDRGFRRLILASSNICAWEPNHGDLETTILANVEHLVTGRSNFDILFELLLRLGLDPCDSIEERQIAGMSVFGVATGPLIVCLGESMTCDLVEELGAGIINWSDTMSAEGPVRVVFRDSGFSDDVAKTNMVAILSQNGINDIRAI